MTKRKTILAVLLGVIMTLCLAFGVACGGEEAEMGTLKWTINDPYNSVTVKVDGSTERPEQYAVGETLTFKVELKPGYTVTVQNGRATLNGNSNNEYSFAVKKGNNEIVITVKRQITGVAVETPPTKLTYYAGEKLDETGMVVKVSYATGESEAVESGYIINYPTDAGYFVLGDTSFTVSYGTKTTAAVELAAPVEVKVTINPVGGVINEGYLTVLSARTDLKNYATEEGGTISFTYSKLDSAIVLPTNEEILLDGGKESSLAGWLDADNNSYKQISVENNLSLDLHANWNLVLVDLQKMELVLEDDTPYLALTMSINTNFSAYAYFLEGKQKIEVKGETIEGKAGETVTAKIDLTKLQNTTNTETGEPVDARGAWMDIRVNTTINGIDLTQAFSYDPENPILDYGQMIHDDQYCYRFIHYMNEGKADLKLYYYDYLTTYYMDVEKVDGKATLKMHGEANTKLQAAQDFPFDGATINITFGSATVTGPVKADGSWEATLDLTTLKHGFNGIATTVIMTSADNSKTLDLGKSGKLDLNGCGTIFENFDVNAGSNQNFYNDYVIDGFRYRVMTDWNEPRISVVAVDDAINEIVGDVELRYDKEDAPTKVYYVVTVKVGKNLDSEETLKSKVTFGDKEDVMNPAEVKSLGDGVYELLFDVTEREADSSKLYVHLYVDGAVWDGSDGNILDSDSSENGKYLVLGEKKYSIANEWSMPNLLVEPYDPTAKTITVTNDDVDLVEEDGKACIVVIVEATNYTDDELKAAVKYGNVDTNSGFNWKTPCIKVVKDGEKYKLYFDLTNMQVGGDGQLWSNLFIGADETKTEIHDDDLSTNGKTVTVAGKKYTIICTGDNGTWRIPCIKVEDAAE